MRKATKLAAHSIGFVVDAITYPYTLVQHRMEKRTHEIHITVKEQLWLWAYSKGVFLEQPKQPWAFLLEAFA